jgi:hypothetical protein
VAALASAAACIPANARVGSWGDGDRGAVWKPPGGCFIASQKGDSAGVNGESYRRSKGAPPAAAATARQPNNGNNIQGPSPVKGTFKYRRLPRPDSNPPPVIHIVPEKALVTFPRAKSRRGKHWYYWVFWRRVRHTCYHRTQVQTWLRLSIARATSENGSARVGLTSSRRAS